MTYHLKELEPTGGPIRNYVLRIFEGKNLRRDPATGQPWKKYCGICVLTVRNRVCEVHSIESAKFPLRCLAILRGPVADDLDLVGMWGERWDEKTETKIIVPVKLLRSANANPLSTLLGVLTFGPVRRAPSNGRPSRRSQLGTVRRTEQLSAVAD